MLPYLTSFYGNPHSRTHAYGWESEKAVEMARKQVSGFFLSGDFHTKMRERKLRIFGWYTFEVTYLLASTISDSLTIMNFSFILSKKIGHLPTYGAK